MNFFRFFIAFSFSLSRGFDESKLVIVKKTFSTESIATIALIESATCSYYDFKEVTRSFE